MISVFEYRCMDCGRVRKRVSFDRDTPEGEAGYDAMCGQIDRWGEDEVLDSKLCKNCKRREDEYDERY